MDTFLDPSAHADWAAIAAQQAAGGTAIDEHGVLATFYDRAVVDRAATEVAGATRFKNRVYLKIVVPADRKLEIDRPADLDGDPKRYPAAWARYRDREREADMGTPLSEMTWITPEQLAMCRAQKVVAVEQLAALADDQVKRIGPNGHALRRRAQEHMKGDDAAVQDLRRENLDLQSHLKEALGRIAALEAAQASMPRKRGRPRGRPAAKATEDVTSDAPDAGAIGVRSDQAPAA